MISCILQKYDKYHQHKCHRKGILLSNSALACLLQTSSAEFDMESDVICYFAKIFCDTTLYLTKYDTSYQNHAKSLLHCCSAPGYLLQTSSAEFVIEKCYDISPCKLFCDVIFHLAKYFVTRYLTFQFFCEIISYLAKYDISYMISYLAKVH